MSVQRSSTVFLGALELEQGASGGYADLILHEAKR